MGGSGIMRGGPARRGAAHGQESASRESAPSGMEHGGAVHGARWRRHGVGRFRAPRAWPEAERRDPMP
eukprot:257244-Prymnesium_polylepis.1